MSPESTSITVFSPVLEQRLDSTPYAARLSTLDNKTIGCLWNDKRHGDVLLKCVIEFISKKYKIKNVIHKKKWYTGEPAPEQVLEELASQCDAIVTATGD